MTTPPITVRRAAPSDAEHIAALSRDVHALHSAELPHVFQETTLDIVSAADYREMMAATNQIVFVAERDGVFAGYARAELLDEASSRLKRASRPLHVHELATALAHRRTGVGRALLRAARAIAPELGATSVSVDFYSFNAGARALYLAEGFLPLRERVAAPVTETAARP